MRFFYAALLFFICYHGMAQSTVPPFTIEAEEILTVPGFGIHSSAVAQSSSLWLFVGGRTEGLHSMYPNTAFNPIFQNASFIVVDTNDWNSYYSSTLYGLPDSISASLSVTNPEFFQEGNSLYIIGGYGFDSLQNKKITYNTLTAIDVDEVMQEVINGTNNFSPYIRQIKDTMFRVTGGVLQKIDNRYYLVCGHSFEGNYTKTISTLFIQHYTNSIRSFDLNDNGTNLSATNWQIDFDSTQLHRRDLNVAPFIDSNGTEGLNIFGGVFQYGHDFPWLNPVHITSSGFEADTFHQNFSQYTCTVIPLYDSVTHRSYFTFLAGISLYDYDDALNTVLVDTMVPFINDINTITEFANGSSEQYLMNEKLPGLMGANTLYFPLSNLARYNNGVIKLRNVQGKTLIGYMFGGIESNANNEGTTNASGRLFRIWLLPDLGLQANDASENNFLKIIPNPTHDEATIYFQLTEPQTIKVQIVNALGESVKTIKTGNLSDGAQQMHIDVSDVPAGFYFLKLKTAERTITSPLIVAK